MALTNGIATSSGSGDNVHTHDRPAVSGITDTHCLLISCTSEETSGDCDTPTNVTVNGQQANLIVGEVTTTTAGCSNSLWYIPLTQASHDNVAITVVGTWAQSQNRRKILSFLIDDCDFTGAVTAKNYANSGAVTTSISPSDTTGIIVVSTSTGDENDITEVGYTQTLEQNVHSASNSVGYIGSLADTSAKTVGLSGSPNRSVVTAVHIKAAASSPQIGTISTARTLQAVSATKSKTLGTVSKQISLAGVSASKLKSTGTLSVSRALVSVSAQKLFTSGSIAASVALQGVSSVKAGTTGTIQSTRSIAGVSYSKTFSLGTLLRSSALSGVVTTKHKTLGSVSVHRTIQGVSGASSTVLGNITTTRTLSAPSASKKTTVGTITTTRSLSPVGTGPTVLGNIVVTRSIAGLTSKKTKQVGSLLAYSTFSPPEKIKKFTVGNLVRGYGIAPISSRKLTLLPSIAVTRTIQPIVGAPQELGSISVQRTLQGISAKKSFLSGSVSRSHTVTPIFATKLKDLGVISKQSSVNQVFKYKRFEVGNVARSAQILSAGKHTTLGTITSQSALQAVVAKKLFEVGSIATTRQLTAIQIEALIYETIYAELNLIREVHLELNLPMSITGDIAMFRKS